VLSLLLLAPIAPFAFLIDYYYRPQLCQAWPWRLPVLGASACVSPLAYEEVAIEDPRDGACNLEELRPRGYWEAGIRWHRMRFTSPRAARKTYAVTIKAWILEGAGWDFADSQPAWSGKPDPERTSGVDPSVGAAWRFTLPPGESATLTLCAVHRAGVQPSSLPSSIGRHVVAMEN
jgi:hypothetical protein